jgi:hypothetical protein
MDLMPIRQNRAVDLLTTVLRYGVPESSEVRNTARRSQRLFTPPLDAVNE